MVVMTIHITKCDFFNYLKRKVMAVMTKAAVNIAVFADESSETSGEASGEAIEEVSSAEESIGEVSPAEVEDIGAIAELEDIGVSPPAAVTVTTTFPLVTAP